MVTKQKKLSHRDYVNNAKLKEELTEYKWKYDDAIKEGKPPPTPSDYIGKVIMEMPRRYIQKWNWNGYSEGWKIEMVDLAQYHLLLGLKSFNPDKCKSAFGWMTQICHNGFLQAIAKEKKQLNLKNKILFNGAASNFFSQDELQGDEALQQANEMIKNQQNYVATNILSKEDLAKITNEGNNL